MAKNKEKVNTKDIYQLQDEIDSLMRNISDITTGEDINKTKELNILSTDIDKIISSEMDMLNATSGGDIDGYINDILSDRTANVSSTTEKTDGNDFIESLASDGALEALFSSKNANDMAFYKDLLFVSNHLYELKEAINTTRDAIVSADSNNDFGRTLELTGTTDESDMTAYIEEIKSIEKELKLLKKIRNHIVPKTLTFGHYYTYVAPYSRILSKISSISKIRNKKRVGFAGTLESSISVTRPKDAFKLEKVQNDDLVAMLESAGAEFPTSIKKKEITKTLETLVDDLYSNIEVVNECSAGEEMEAIFESNGVPAIDLIKADIENKTKKAISLNIDKATSDGVIEDYSDIKGCKIKIFNPTHVAEVEVGDTVIGYYVVLVSGMSESGMPINVNSCSNSINKMSSSLFTNSADSSLMNNKLERNLVSTMADSIIQKFDKKYLEKNIKFRDVIIGILEDDNNFKKRMRFQFIPASQMVKFSIDEDENGKGQSMLKDSVFPAKLYLALLLFKVLAVLNNGADQHYYYIKSAKKGDRDVARKTQSVISALARTTISYDDMLTNDNLIRKVGAGRKVVVPVGQSDTRGVEQEIVSAQDVPMETELLEKLRTWFINGTNCPSVITNYMNESEFAKGIEMGHAKYARTVTGYQQDFNDPLTDLYKMVIRACTSIPESIANTFTFKLNQPRSLVNMVNNDFLQSVESNLETMVNNVMGKEAELSPEDLIIKDKLMLALLKRETPNLPWEEIEEMKTSFTHDTLLGTMKKKLKDENFALAKGEGGSDSGGESEY